MSTVQNNVFDLDERVSMSDLRQPRIAINVMRARLTVVGFNIAIVSFQVSELFGMQGGISIPGFTHLVHFRADMALLMALVFSLMALVAFIASSSIDDVGHCDHWSFIAGDLLMYLGLANAVTGFFSPLNEAFRLASAEAMKQQIDITSFGIVIMLLGGVTWFMTIYLGPLVTLCRSPFSRVTNASLAFCYLFSLLLIFGLYHQVFLFEVLTTQGRLNNKQGLVLYLYEFVQPFIW